MNDLKKMIEDYRISAIKHGEALQEGNKIIANRSYTKINKLFLSIQYHSRDVATVLMNLLHDDSLFVQSWAAAHSLSLGVNIVVAEGVLDRLSKRTDIGIARLNAEMILYAWRTKGSLNF